MGLFIGIDVGTTGTKTILIDGTGAVLATSTHEYPLSTPRPNWSEQDPEDWWKATVVGIQAVLEQAGIAGAEVKGLGLSGQMHGAVFLDAQDRVLRPAILWNDQRTGDECEEITSHVGAERLVELTCNPALTGFTAPKMVWVRNHEPRVYEKTRKVLLPKDYVRLRLTGEYATEVSDASGTLLFDVTHRRWSNEVMDALGIDADLMPASYESQEISGHITGAVAKETGLPAGTPVVGGGGDQAAGAVGNGIVESGVISATLGTSGVVFAHSDTPELDPRGRLHTFCHAVPGKWHMMGVMLSAGGSFRWCRDVLGQEEVAAAAQQGVDPYELLTELAAQAPAGCEGLVFLPYLAGERTPHADPNARGVFFGLSLRHQRTHLVRAVMEGVTFGMRDSLEIIRGLNVPVKQIRASGGGGKSSFWRQMQADVYAANVAAINVDEGPAFGAALLAAVGTGAYASVEEACRATIEVSSETASRPEVAEVYDAYYEVFKSLYPQSRELFGEVVRLADRFHS